MLKHWTQGFTLVEVLIALLIIAIGLTALLKTGAQNIQSANRIKDKSISHLVGMSALAEVQMNAIHIQTNQESTHTTRLLGTTWYWRAKISPTQVRSMQQITVSVSPRPTGPFTNRLIGYRYAP